MTETREATAAGPDEAAAPRRAWWQRLPVLLLVGVLPVYFGLFFMAFVAAAMLLRDQTRDSDTRAGGTVAFIWWAYSFRQGDTTPFVSVPLLALAATLFARSALARRRDGGGAAWAPAGAALVMVAFAVAAVVPYGFRKPVVTRDDAVARVVAERTARPWRGIDATSFLADRGRTRLVHAPQWYVALYERHASVERTRDGQPCFSRREVWRVDAVDGEVGRSTYDEAQAGGDPCLPIRAGTERDLRPLPR